MTANESDRLEALLKEAGHKILGVLKSLSPKKIALVIRMVNQVAGLAIRLTPPKEDDGAYALLAPMIEALADCIERMEN